MVYYRLYAILKHSTFEFPYLCTQESTELLRPPPNLCPHSVRTNEQAFEHECEQMRLQYGHAAEHRFRYIMDKNDLLACSWLACFPIFCRSSMKCYFAFEDDEPFIQRDYRG